METNPAGNDLQSVDTPKKPSLAWFGWAGFVVTIGVLLHQIWNHGEELATYFLPITFNGDLAAFLDSAKFNTLFKFTHMLEFANALFIAGFAVVILVLLALRRKSVPKLLVIFIAVAGCYNIVLVALLALQPAAFLQSINVNLLTYSLESLAYLVIDVILLIYYLRCRQFRVLFVK